jgi:hypothetical protein
MGFLRKHVARLLGGGLRGGGSAQDRGVVSAMTRFARHPTGFVVND